MEEEVLQRLTEVFAAKAPPSVAEAAQREAQLFQKIGQLEMELELLKKKSAQLHG